MITNDEKHYNVTMTEKQYNDWLEHLTYPPNIQDVKKPNKKEFGDTKHPTLKPVKLMEWLVKLLSNEGDTVLDLFGGSGTTGVACVNLDRKFILIERQEQYCKDAQRRIDEALQKKADETRC